MSSGCALCPVGKFSVFPGQTISGCGALFNGTCLPSFDFNIVSNMVPGAKPWGVYSAVNWNSATNKLPELQGTRRDAFTSGAYTKGYASGNGATGFLDYISGDATTSIMWPINSLPTSFTICASTRYTGTAGNNRILRAFSIDFGVGHYGGKRGLVWINTLWKTQSSTSIGTLTNWLVTCVKNDASVAGSVLLDGVASGTNQGQVLANADILTINAGTVAPTERSNFSFSSLIVWDVTLTDSQMASVSSQLMYWQSPTNITRLLNCQSGEHFHKRIFFKKS